MKLFGTLSELVSLIFRKDSQQVTVRPNQATTYTASRDIQLPPGDASHTLTSADSTQSLTNKTIVAASNTITTAASGNLTAVELNAALSELQTDIDTRATSTALSNHEADTTTHGTTGDIVGTSDTQTLSNKNFIDNTTKFVDDSDNTKTFRIETSGSTTAIQTTLSTSSTSNRNITLPDITDTLVSRESSDTGANRIRNKDFDDDTVKFVQASDFTRQLRFDLDSAATSTSTTISAAQTGNRVVTLPDATTTLVGTDTAQAITNKTQIRVDDLTLDGATVSTTSGQLQLSSGGGPLLLNSSTQITSNNTLSFNDSDNTNSITISVPANVTSDRTPQIPDDTGNFVLTSALQPLTNKTINGSSNTLTVLAASQLSGATPIANGGTGQITANDGLNALLPSQAGNSGKVLGTDATNTSWVSVPLDPTTTRGDLIRRGASSLERLAAVTDNRVVRGDGTDVISGQIDDPAFFTTGAEVTQALPGVVKSAGQLKGTNTNDSAAAGYVGEVVEGAGSTTSTSITNLTSVALTAGDWVVTCTALANLSSSNAGDYVDFAFSTANNNLTGAVTYNSITYGVSRGHFTCSTSSRGMGTLIMHIQLSGSQTYYLNSSFGGTGTISGHIVAQRIR